MGQIASSTQAPLVGGPLPVELMNTIWADRSGIHDALDTLDGLCGWLNAVSPRLGVTLEDAAGRPVPLMAADDVPCEQLSTLARELRSLRDALRRMAALATDDDRPAAVSVVAVAVAEPDTAIAAINRACALAPASAAIRWSDGGEPTRTWRSNRPAGMVVISRLAEAGVALFTGPERSKLRACHAPGCVLYFVRDHPRREWCSAGCGNRARVARHYRRHHPATT